METKGLNIAVLMGGIGSEREVSLNSGRSVAAALKEAGMKVVEADIAPDKLEILDESGIDVFFIALHGQFGEDGQLQQIMEDKGLVYTGSGPIASRTAFDKMACKKVFSEAGVVTPTAIEIKNGISDAEIEKQLKVLGDKYVVKPLKQGSSVGVNIVSGKKKPVEAARKCLEEFGDCMIEKFIPGREMTVGILCGEALPIIEIRPKDIFFDYHAKYVDDRTEFLFDTIETTALNANIKSAAMDCFNALGCRHFARVDFILDSDEIAYALEVNTIPGFTSHSLLPKAAAKMGISMSRLCVKIIEAAMEDKCNNNFVNANKMTK
jgi:D-alanine-D-alanine ligase